MSLNLTKTLLIKKEGDIVKLYEKDFKNKASFIDSTLFDSLCTDTVKKFLSSHFVPIEIFTIRRGYHNEETNETTKDKTILSTYYINKKLDINILTDISREYIYITFDELKDSVPHGYINDYKFSKYPLIAIQVQPESSSNYDDLVSELITVFKDKVSLYKPKSLLETTTTTISLTNVESGETKSESKTTTKTISDGYKRVGV